MSVINDITLLNQTTLESLKEVDEIEIIKHFTHTGIKILGADFGFVWLTSPKSKKLKLAYKSSSVTFTPTPPRKGGRNFTAIRSGIPNFVIKIKKNLDARYVRKYMKSFIIIPLVSKKDVYGTMVLCFKKTEQFPQEKRIMSVLIGNTVAQTMTIHRLFKKEHELVLFKHTKRLLREEKIKNEFIANATHEIRTPLAIIKGNIDLSLMKKTTSLKLLKNISNEINHLSSIISDLTLLTENTENLKNRVNFRQVEIVSLLDSIIKRYKVLAKKKEITVKFTKTEMIYLWGDSIILEKLFSNLLRNAITYGREKGWIEIQILVKKNLVQIKFSDNGIGIEKKYLPRIFDRFFRANRGRATEVQNMGLGLPIVKWAVSAHKGKISVKSKINKGTTFIISFTRLNID